MSLEAALWERRRRSFFRFFVDCWPHIPGEAGTPLVLNWSIKAVCDRLDMLARGTLGKNNLCINIPPGLGKSTIVSVAFPAWVWSWWPEWANLQISGSEDVALRDSRKCRELIRSDWYQSSRPGWRITKDGEEWIQNSRGGERQMATIGSRVTGKRVHHIGIDDPNETKDVSEAKLSAVADAWNLGIGNRLKDMVHGTKTLIQQRVHLQDLTGIIMAQGGEHWHHLVIRTKFEAGDPQKAPEDPRTEDGELLFPERFPQWVIDMEEGRMQSFGFAGQHQQRPIPREGGSWKVDQIEIVDVAPAGMVEARGWDLAASKGKGDWCCGARLGRMRDGRYCIVDMVRERTSEPRKLARLTAGLDGQDVRVSVPQDPGQAGKDQVRTMTGEFAGFSFSSSPESGAKETRWEPFQSQINGGNVCMVRGSWNAVLLDEMRTNGQVHDDQLDALARAFSVVCAPADAWIAEAERIANAERERLEGNGIDPDTGVASFLGSAGASVLGNS